MSQRDLLLSAGGVEVQAQAKTPTANILAYSGGVMNVPGWGPVVIDLAGLEISASTTVLADHDGTIGGVAGAGTAEVRGGQLYVTATIVAGSKAGGAILELARGGVAFQASVGVAPIKTSRVAAGATIHVNGRSITTTTAVTLIERGRLREVSITAIGADPATTVSIAARKTNHMSNENTNVIETDELPELDPVQARAKHVSELCTTTSVVNGRVVREPNARLVMAALSGGWNDDTIAQAVEASRAQDMPVVSSHTRQRRGPDSGKVIEASLCLAAGLGDKFVAEQYGEQVTDAATSAEYRGMGLQGVMRHVMQAAGVTPPAARFNDSTIRTAFEADRTLRASGFSTFSLPGIMGNVANKSMLAAYQEIATTWRLFAAVASNSDFKQHARYRLVGKGQFTQVAADGQIKHLELGEQDYGNKLETSAAMLAITRQDLINDDMDALTALPRMIGRMGAIALERAVYTRLLNAGSFFATGSGNYFEGATSALSIDSLTVAEQMFLDQRDENGDPILINPRVLLVPTSLATTAAALVNSTEIRNTAADTQYTVANPHAGKFTAAVSPWLSDERITGHSSTAFYLMAGPGDLSAIEVAFLDGRQTPTVETADTDFNVLGIQMRGYFDFGVALRDHRGAIKSKGAAA